MDILQIRSVSKRFGTHTVVDGLNFAVKEGSIFGFIGQNGAGKTTTMKMILGLLPSDSGEITVCGEHVRYGENKTNKFIGYLPDVPEFYNYMTSTEYLKLCGEITGMSSSLIKSRTIELLSLVGLESNRKKIGGYSRGMKQRLGIAQALLGEPKLLICDEPTSALDPIGRVEILEILQKVKGKTTVIFSTHILSDVERICDEIAVLHEGKIALSGTIAELKSKHKQDGISVEFSALKEKTKFLECLQSKFALNEIIENGLEVKLLTNHVEALQTIAFECLVSESILPKKIEVLEPSIESLFMEVVQ